MARDERRDTGHENEGWHREPVHGSTYDRGLPFRESASGRDYPGSLRRVEDDYGYSRGPYIPSGIEDRGYEDYKFRTGSYNRDPNTGGFDLGGGMDEDWDRELGLRGTTAPDYNDQSYGSEFGGRNFRNHPYDEETYRRGSTAPYTETWSVPGPFSGRGPKGYERSVEKIRSDVCERLAMHGQIDASDIEVRVENGEVTLEGTVDSRRTKRLAEDVVESVVSVKDVHNHLRIRQEQQNQQQQEL